jgi:Winged helix DNA-binding domain
MVDVGWDGACARRLARSSLRDRTGPEDLVGLAADLCGVHAQIQTSAELQLAVRLEGLIQKDVRAALWEERVLVKAWTVRGTLHLHPAEELPLWLAARRAVLGSAAEGLPAWRDPHGATHPALAAEEVEAVRAAVREALDGRCLLRDELAAAVVERVGAAPQERLRSGFAFFLDELCQGPPRGSRITLARPDQWIAGWREVTDEREALREVCRRFLRTYGPATPTGFCEWLGSAAFRVAEVRKLFDELAAELDEVAVDGRSCFVLAGDTVFPEPADEVRLLPEYDVYVMASRERDRLVPDAVRKLIAVNGRGRYEGPAGTRLVVVGGVAVGLWGRRKRGRRIELRVRLARRSGGPGRRALEREAERIGAFLGLEPTLHVESA